MPQKKPYFYGTGKRKTAIARVFVSAGEGKMMINNREKDVYFGRETLRYLIKQPFVSTGTLDQFDVRANICGGGLSAQADALKYGIAKALLQVNADYRKPLKNAGFLTRDARIVERKHYGHRGARRSPQFSKR
jgi:small subunit ribosomal protein S9